jgi:hypothetical protein
MDINLDEVIKSLTDRFNELGNYSFVEPDPIERNRKTFQLLKMRTDLNEEITKYERIRANSASAIISITPVNDQERQELESALNSLNTAIQQDEVWHRAIGLATAALEAAAKVRSKASPTQAMTLGSAGRAGSLQPTSRRAYYGWIRDLPDHRDFLYAAKMPSIKKLPDRIDLRSDCPPVENQLQLGSCTANALVGALEFLQIKLKQPLVDLSRLFVYYNEREMEGTVDQDSGAALRDGIKSLRDNGICSEDLWPYDISRFRERPPQNCYQKALDHQIIEYQSIRTLDEARTCLAEGFPFAFGFAVYSGFESDAVAKSGVLSYPTKTEEYKGGHAVMAVGYDDKSQRFIVRNSWGWDWEQAGYFTMPYEYAFGSSKRQALAMDFWTIRSTE